MTFLSQKARAVILTAVMLVVLGQTGLWAMGSEWFTDEKLPSEPWPKGRAIKIYSSSGGFGVSSTICYCGDTIALNRLLILNSQRQNRLNRLNGSGNPLEVVLHASPGRHKTFFGKELTIDWEFYYSPIQSGANAKEKENVWPTRPSVFIYIDPERQHIDLNELKIPKDCTLITVRDLLPRYLNGLKSQNYEARKDAAYLLGTIHPLEEYAILPLINLLDDTNSDVRHQTVVTLGNFGLKAYAALPALHTALNDEKAFIVKDAKAAIAKIEKSLEEQEKQAYSRLKQLDLFVAEQKRLNENSD
jgi:hypothetical protein